MAVYPGYTRRRASRASSLPRLLVWCRRRRALAAPIHQVRAVAQISLGAGAPSIRDMGPEPGHRRQFCSPGAEPLDEVCVRTVVGARLYRHIKVTLVVMAPLDPATKQPNCLDFRLLRRPGSYLIANARNVHLVSISQKQQKRPTRPEPSGAFSAGGTRIRALPPVLGNSFNRLRDPRQCVSVLWFSPPQIPRSYHPQPSVSPVG